jgi:hypothetical protein
VVVFLCGVLCGVFVWCFFGGVLCGVFVVSGVSTRHPDLETRNINLYRCAIEVHKQPYARPRTSSAVVKILVADLMLRTYRRHDRSQSQRRTDDSSKRFAGNDAKHLRGTFFRNSLNVERRCGNAQFNT